jgi:sarcosine oxidase subunit alpha
MEKEVKRLVTVTWHPIKYSAIYRKHLALGATMTDFYGWQVAAHFTSPDKETQQVRENVGLADVSWLVKLDVKSREWKMENGKWKMENGSIYQLAQGHWMVICEPQEVEAARETLERQAVVADCFHVIDMTSAYSALLLAGPKSRYVLNKLTDLDVSEAAMPNLSCAQTGLAHVRAIVLRQDIGNLLAYRLLVGREYGEYVWDAVMHAGQEYSIVPFGLTAQGLLRLET